MCRRRSYYVAARVPGEEVVLRRNPNYHGARSDHLAEIEVELDVGPARNIADVEAGKADYNFGAVANPATDPARLRRLYGPGSPAARGGDQRWFERTQVGVAWMTFNTRRPLFAGARMRRAVSFAVDRTSLAKLGSPPQRPTSGYLPPGMPGYRNQSVFPLHRDLAKARLLAGKEAHRSAVLYTFADGEGREKAELVKQALAAIGIGSTVSAFPPVEFFRRIGAKKARFDIAVAGGWNADYLDPDEMLSLPFDGTLIARGQNPGRFDDPSVHKRLDAAEGLRGVARYRAYNRLAFDLARTQAPVVAYGVFRAFELFSNRIGCRVYQPIMGVDLAALCIR